MKVEIWSDPLYPTCWQTLRRMTQALARFDGRDDVELVWRSFEILPDQPSIPGETLAELKIRLTGAEPEQLARRIEEVKREAAAEGMAFNLVTARPVSSFDAHRLLRLAAARGRRDAALERCFKAYIDENLNIADAEVLRRLGAEIGLDSGEVDALLAGDAYAAEVRADEARAAELGITTVPTLLVDGRDRATGELYVDDLVTLLERASGSAGGATPEGRGDTTTPSTAAAATRGFAGTQLKAPVPAGVERELLALCSEDGAWHNAAIYRRAGTRPRHGIVLMHPAADFMGHYALGPFAQMGFAALAVNPRFASESDAIMEQCVLDLASGVEYLREQGCETVALLGNSGGGGLACFYQAQAERPTVTATPAGDPPDLTAARLPAADALILLNAHRGRPQVVTSYLDPSVVDERDPLTVDPGLDMFDPQNGPPYAPRFVERYRAAQVERNHRITRWAQERLADLAGQGVRDEAFIVHRTVAALEMLDPSLDPSDRPLGWYGGPDVQYQNRAASSIARFNTLRGWLSQFGLETSNALSGPNLAHVTVPVLVVQGTADEGIFPADAEALRDASGCADTTLVWVKDGRHFFADQPALQQETLERVAAWLGERGLAPDAAA